MVQANELVCPNQEQGYFDAKGMLELRREVDRMSLADIGRYCRYQMTDRFLRSRPESEHLDANEYWRGKKSLDEVMKDSALKLKLRGDANFDAWELSALPAMNARMNGALEQLKINSELTYLPPTAKDDEGLNKTKKYFLDCAEGRPCPKERRFPNKNAVQQMADFDVPGLDDRVKKGLRDAGSDAALLNACSELTLLSAFGCKDNVKKNIQFVSPSGVGFYSTPSLYKKIFSDGSYSRGLSVFAIKLIDHEKQSRTQPLQANVFDDLKESFRAGGATAQAAEDMAWNTMGLWATTGANLKNRLEQLKTSPAACASAEALTVMSALLPVLDGRSAKGLYSFPKEANNSCDNGKAYHFWLSAFLARQNTLENNDGIAAASASMVVQKGYQVMGRTTGGDKRRSDQVLKYDSYHSVQNVVRMDLNFASAGAVFGAASAEGKNISLDMDQGLRQLHDDGAISTGHEPPGPGFLGNISAYGDWSAVFNPNPQFQRYSKDAGL